jgi:hypothetical protein
MACSFRSDTPSNVVTLSSRASLGRRSRSNENRRCLAGRSIEETIEFEALEALPAFDDNGNIARMFEGEPTTRREKRWLEFYRKHRRDLAAAAALITLTRLLG